MTKSHWWSQGFGSMSTPILYPRLFGVWKVETGGAYDGTHNNALGKIEIETTRKVMNRFAVSVHVM